MKLFYLMILLLFGTHSLIAQGAHSDKKIVRHVSAGAASQHQPDNVVRKLYRQVVLLRPLGIPSGASKTAIWPFLSKALIQRFELAQACEKDYYRQRAKDDGTPEFGWLESGLFSGENEKATPAAAIVERTEPQKDGSCRVYVRLTYKESFATYSRPPDPANTFHWHVAATVIPEDGRFVVDDILQFKDDSTEIESRLSDALVGCNGSQWVGNEKVGSR